MPGRGSTRPLPRLEIPTIRPPRSRKARAQGGLASPSTTSSAVVAASAGLTGLIDDLTLLQNLSVTLSARVDNWSNTDGRNLETSAATGLPTANNRGELADKDDTVVSPRGALLYRISDRVSVWGSFSMGFRAPTLNIVTSGSGTPLAAVFPSIASCRSAPPPNGDLPVAASYRTVPRLNRSDRASIGSPRTCSGLM